MLRFLLLIAGLGLVGADNIYADLQLTSNVNGHRVAITRVTRYHLYTDDGGTAVEVANDAPLFIEGDLRRNAASVMWTPACEVHHPDVPDRDPNRNSVIASVRLSHEPTENRDSGVAYDSAWGPTSSPTLVVLGWVVDGRITAVFAQPVPATDKNKDFQVEHDFLLGRGQEHGHAIAMVWHDGGFVTPRPPFANAQSNERLYDIMFDDATSLHSGLNTADVSARDRAGRTLLDYAAGAGSINWCAALVGAGADPGISGSTSWPLAKATRMARADIVQLLIAKSRQPTTPSDITTLLLFAIDGRNESLALDLIHAGALVEPEKLPFLDNPMAHAISAGLDSVADELDRRTDNRAFAAYVHGLTRSHDLVASAKAGHCGMVRYMLRHGSSASQAFQGVTPLMAAARNGDPEIAKVLLAAGADVNGVGDGGVTALMETAESNSDAFARALLESGANSKLRDSTGRTALHWCARLNASAVAHTLLSGNADVQAEADGKTALETAIALDATDTARELAVAGAKIRLQKPESDELLAHCIASDLAPVVQSALRDHWSPQVRIGKWSPLAIAKIFKANACVQLLQKAGATEEPTLPDTAPTKGNVSGLKLVHSVPAADPRDLERGFASATVVVEALVDVDGSVPFARGIAGARVDLIHAALDAVRRWRFTPAVVQGSPVPIVVRLPIQFRSSLEICPELWDLDSRPTIEKEGGATTSVVAARVNYGGRVLLRFLVDQSGRARHISVLLTSDSRFNNHAIEGLEHTRFKPAMRDGKPVCCWVERPYDF